MKESVVLKVGGRMYVILDISVVKRVRSEGGRGGRRKRGGEGAKR